MVNDKKKAGSKSISPFDQTNKIVSDFAKQLKDKEFKALLQEHNDEYAAAEPMNELADEDLKTINEDLIFQRGCKYTRNILNAIIENAGYCLNAELVKLAHKGLGLLDQIENGNRSLHRELETTVDTVIELCRIEDGKQKISSGQEQDTTTHIKREKNGKGESDKKVDELPEESQHMSAPQVANPEIPPDFRTPPMSRTELAKYWKNGMTQKTIKTLVDNGTLKAAGLSRQRFIFDKRGIPSEVVERIQAAFKEGKP